MRCRPSAATLFSVLLAASCGASRQLAVPTPLSASDLARAQTAAAATLGQPATAAFQQMRGYRLADGSTVACGEMRGVDPFGTDWGFAPIYVRMSAAQVLRVHADDTTGYGPASIGCERAASGLARG